MKVIENGIKGFRLSGKISGNRASLGGLDLDLESQYSVNLLAEKNVLGSAVITKSGEVVTINDYYLTKILGISREEFEREGLNLLDITPSGLEIYPKLMAEYEATGCIQPFEVMRYRRDGSSVWTLQGYAGFEENPGFMASFAIDITAKKRDEITSQYLLEANKIMASSVELQPLLEKIVNVTLVNGFCDFCTIHLRQEEGGLICRAVTHKDPDLTRQVKRIIERFPHYLSEAIGPSRVVRTGQSEMSALVARTAQSRAVNALTLQSYMSVPLNVSGKVIGALTLTSLSRHFETEDLKTAEALALRASQHIENAKLHEDLKRSTLELERSNRDLTHYASIAAHDLKSPLATSQSYLNLLLEECGGELNDEHRRWLEKVIESNTKLLSQVDRLLTFSHSERDRVEHQVVDLNELVLSVMENLQTEIENSTAEVIFGTLPTVKGDPTLLALLFQNLFSNSIRYRKPEVAPRIQITAEQGKDGWTFHVTDNGKGFDSSSAEKIFSLFEQLPGTKSQGTAGYGIGLATCRKIVEGHCGKIWAESQPGHGARFSFTLPEQEA